MSTLRLIRSVLSVAVLAVLAIACSDTPTGSGNTDPAPAAAAPMQQTNVTSTMQGEMKTITGDNLPLPGNFPKDIPLPGGYRITSVTTLGNRINLGMAFSKGGTEITQALLAQLEEDKWKVANNTAVGDGAMISAQKDGRSWQFTVAGEGSDRAQMAVAGEIADK